MKKILSIALGAAAMAGLLASCSESTYDEQYSDPSKTDKVSINQVFTGVMNAGNTWMNPIYYRYYTQSTTSGTFSGIIGNANGKGRFRGATEGPFNTRWKDFYNMVTQYRVLEQNFNELEADQQTANKVFFLMGRTLVEAQLHEMCSLFGPVPFTNAGNLWKTGEFEASKPAYDSDVDLYKMILVDLKEAGDYLAGEVSAAGASAFKRADFSDARGNLDIWRRYTNSLRLRVALHLVNGDCASEAKAAIKEILENPDKYPVIEDNSQNMTVSSDLSTDTYNFGKSFSQALHTSGNSYGVVSQAVLDALKIGADGKINADSDPRVQAMLDPNPDNAYVAYDVTLSSTKIDDAASEAEQGYVADKCVGAHYYCRVDSQAIQGVREYGGNDKTKGLWLSAAEVQLSKAEAYLMGYGVGADADKAKAAFKAGVVASCDYYWNTKLTSSFYDGDDSYAAYRELTVPSTLDFENYAEAAWDGTQKTVCTQLWLNHFVWNELEAWNVVRRTGFPEVKFAEDNIQNAYPTPALRLPYPTDESSYNKANYEDAVAKYYKESTGYYTKLFWAKDGAYYNIVAKH